MSRVIRSGFAVLLLAGMAAPCLAEDPATTPPPSQTPTKTQALDPNQVICEKQEVIGSRLATKRVCKTRAQWADDRLQDRQEIDKVQTQRGMIR